MNIFVLNLDSNKCAEQYVDKHVIKMIVETAQLLCTTHHILGTELGESELYKKTHENHPCAIWARENEVNYKWLVKLGLALCKEYTYRFGKIHKTEGLLVMLERFLPKKFNTSNTILSKFALAMPDECKIIIDNDMINQTVESYKNYYNKEKKHLFKWSKREQPNWIIFN